MIMKTQLFDESGNANTPNGQFNHHYSKWRSAKHNCFKHCVNGSIKGLRFRRAKYWWRVAHRWEVKMQWRHLDPNLKWADR